MVNKEFNVEYHNDANNNQVRISQIELNNNSIHNKSKCKFTKTIGLIFMICLTSLFFLVELIIGHITKSNTLVADAFHMLSDVISLCIGLLAVRISKRTVAKRNTYGWVRSEVLGSLINSVFLLALCFSIIIEAINRYFEPHPLENVELMLIVGGIGLFINIIGLVMFGILGHDHDHTHSKDLNIQGVFLHVLSDALGSIAVIISGLIVKYASPKNNTNVKWKMYIDPTLSILITIFIITNTVSLFKKSSFMLLQGVPQQFDIENLKNLVRNINGVLDVHHFHIWSLNTDKLIATAHLRVTKQDNYSEIDTLYDVKRLLHKYDIHATTLQLEYENENISTKKFDYCDNPRCIKKQCCNDILNNTSSNSLT